MEANNQQRTTKRRRTNRGTMTCSQHAMKEAQDVIDGWNSLPDELHICVLSYLDVPGLVQKKIVCRKWRQRCTLVIDAKRTTESQRVFETNQELKDAVVKYCRYNPEDAEDFATTYGWPIGKWDVSNVEDFSRIFSDGFRGRNSSIIKRFNEDISCWDVSRATSMYQMFYLASSFNQDLSSWDVSSVTNMSYMFNRARKFNGDVSSWDTSNVTTMEYMFSDAFTFNQNLSTWDVSSVTNMHRMFMNAMKFNQHLSNWDTSSITNMSYMFFGAFEFNGDVSSWDTSNVTAMEYMFYDAVTFNQNLSSWNTSNVRSLNNMFTSATSFNQDIVSWDSWDMTKFEVDPDGRNF